MQAIWKYVKDLIMSFSTEKGGFSARKLSAFVAVLEAIHLTEQHVNPDNLVSAQQTWLMFAGICLGIVTVEQIIKFKNGSTTTEITKETSESKETIKTNGKPDDQTQ